MKSRRSRLSPKFVLIGLLLVGGLAGGGFVMHRSNQTVRADAPVASPGARNAVRKQHLKQMAIALQAYIQQNGSLPIKVSTKPVGICSGTGQVCRASGMVDLMFVANRGYINALPSDPIGGPGRYATGYQLHADAAGDLVLTAPRSETSSPLTQKVQ